METKMKRKILSILSKSGKKGIAVRELKKLLKAGKPPRDQQFERELEALFQSGKLMVKKHRLVLAEQSGKIAAQIVRVNKTFGFARDERETEYFIPGKFLMGALPGDQVLLKKIPSRGTSLEAEVVKVTQYGSGEFTGKLVKEDGGWAILPDTLMKDTVRVKKSQLSGAREGDKVLAKIVSRGSRHSEHRAAVLSSFGDAATAASCAQAVLELNGIRDEFPPEVLEQAKFLQKRGIKSKEYEHRTDFRNEVVFTIDGADSKDLDDAVSIHKYPDCYELGVHIADVSHYVIYGSELDQEAFRRGTSIYYADQVIPMLPRELSNGICSLNPGEDRLTLSVVMTLDLDGNLTDFDFQKGVIRSRVKGVYSEINQLLEGETSAELTEKYASVWESLQLMRELAELRLQRRKERGAPDLDTTESKIITDERGIAVDIKPRVSGFSEHLIEEFMLLANEAAAMAGKMKELPYVYRVHEPPTAEKLEKLNVTLRLLGLQKKNLSPNVKPKALAEILDKVRDSDLHSIVNVQVLRAMSKAKYSETPIGHYGLALENYAHFTSPIRRYADLQVHRALTAFLEGSSPKAIAQKYEQYAKQAALQATQTEITAMKVERDCEDCYKAEYMQKHIGETFEGIISSVAGHGIYVELPNTVEGMVRVEDLPDGEYYFDEVMQYKNLTTGQVFKIGDPMTVICAKCDVNSGNIDFTPVFDEIDEDGE
ncbi:MAG: ribonuclease R [Massiliimalia sp.]|jgi:ribonuclease R